MTEKERNRKRRRRRAGIIIKRGTERERESNNFGL